MFLDFFEAGTSSRYLRQHKLSTTVCQDELHQVYLHFNFLPQNSVTFQSLSNKWMSLEYIFYVVRVQARGLYVHARHDRHRSSVRHAEKFQLCSKAGRHLSERIAMHILHFTSVITSKESTCPSRTGWVFI